MAGLIYSRGGGCWKMEGRLEDPDLGTTGPVEPEWLRHTRSRSSGGSFAESPLAKVWARADTAPSVTEEIVRLREAHKQAAAAEHDTEKNDVPDTEASPTGPAGF